ncbi:MAG: SCP2 sterol-binding domain-containing protein [Deltaproteobacteria bacterium]|nr:SCP2 sterol-binding domain-containing protein [Deltaproteobacteria bacterium]
MVDEERRDPNILDTEAVGPAASETAAASSRAEGEPDLLAVDLREDGSHAAMPGFTDPEMHSPQRESKPLGAPRGSKDLRDFIMGEIGARSERAGRKLKTQLSSLVQLELTDLNHSFLFDWQGSDLRIHEGSDPQADCRIALSSTDLWSISNGELNAQIAMLSDKVKVSGKAGVAVYFFNLFAHP